VLFDQVCPKGRSDFASGLERLVDSPLPRDVVRHIASIPRPVLPPGPHLSGRRSLSAWRTCGGSAPRHEPGDPRRWHRLGCLPKGDCQRGTVARTEHPHAREGWPVMAVKVYLGSASAAQGEVTYDRWRLLAHSATAFWSAEGYRGLRAARVAPCGSRAGAASGFDVTCPGNPNRQTDQDSITAKPSCHPGIPSAARLPSAAVPKMPARSA
jgi:hypothetical protein